jgi:hypothetical protein
MTDEPKEQTIGGMLDRLPAWAQIGLVLYNLAGLPTCILVYNALENSGVIPNVVDERLTAIESGMQQDAGHAIRHDTTMQEMVKAIQDQARHLEDSAKRDQMKCILKAHTDDEKKACLK